MPILLNSYFSAKGLHVYKQFQRPIQILWAHVALSRTFFYYSIAWSTTHIMHFLASLIKWVHLEVLQFRLEVKKIIWLSFDIQLLNRLERSSSIFIEYCCKLQIAIIRFMDCSWTWFGANCSHGWLDQLIMGVTRLKRAWNLV